MGPLYIIGNGPSLTPTDLDLLVGKESWAMNRIHLIYPKTKWRPTRWLWIDVSGSDPIKLSNEAKKIHFGEGYACYVYQGYRERLDMTYGLEAYGPNIHYVSVCGREGHVGADIRHTMKPDAWHINATALDHPDPDNELVMSGTLCKFGSGIFYWIQLGIALKYDPIVLLGCDLYSHPANEGPDLNHFDSSYGAYSGYDAKVQPEVRNQTLIHGHKLCASMASQYGVRILNATRGGLLEVYPRVELEEVL
jgi:hypothetical protein